MLTQGELFMIHMLKAEGLTINAIARRTGLDRKTIRHHLQSGLTASRCMVHASQGVDYLKGRVTAYPEISGGRLHREIAALGYEGGYTLVTDYLREVRPQAESGFERRFETSAGKQAQVDFAQFKVCFGCEPMVVRIVWLFSMLLGYSRYLFARFVWRQTLDVVVRCHMEALAEFGGVPQEILYDRMKTAVLGEMDDGEIIYHPTLLSLAGHYGFRPKACRPRIGSNARIGTFVKTFFLVGCFTTWPI